MLFVVVVVVVAVLVVVVVVAVVVADFFGSPMTLFLVSLWVPKVTDEVIKWSFVF